MFPKFSKKWLMKLLCLSFMLAPSGAFAAGKIKVVTSLQDLAAITSAMGGENVEVFSIGKGTQDPHFVPPKPSYILKLKDADMVVQIGMGLEPWLPPLIENSRNMKLFRGAPGFVDTSFGIPVLNVPFGKVDRSLGDVHGQGNPHYWLDPVNAKYISANIVAGLKRVDPADGDYFDQHRQAFLKALASKLTGWMKEAKPLNGVKVITYHQSWPYFEKRFGLNVVCNIEPKPGIQPSPKYIASLIDRVKAEHIQLIIMEPYFNRQIPDMIAKVTGIKVVILPPSVGGVPGVNDYFELFDYQLNALLKSI